MLKIPNHIEKLNSSNNFIHSYEYLYYKIRTYIKNFSIIRLLFNRLLALFIGFLSFFLLNFKIRQPIIIIFFVSISIANILSMNFGYFDNLQAADNMVYSIFHHRSMGYRYGIIPNFIQSIINKGLINCINYKLSMILFYIDPLVNVFRIFNILLNSIGLWDNVYHFINNQVIILSEYDNCEKYYFINNNKNTALVKANDNNKGSIITNINQIDILGNKVVSQDIKTIKKVRFHYNGEIGEIICYSLIKNNLSK